MTNLAIIGFGNVGQEVFQLATEAEDFRVTSIATRDPARIVDNRCLQVPSCTISDLQDLSDNRWYKFADVAILCGGSKNDLPIFGPYAVARIDTIDSFDTHGLVGEYIDKNTGLPKNGYFQMMDLAARSNGHRALVCQGWDPGLFSLMRGLFRSSLDEGARIYTFYGLTKKGGLSMGHSDALRQIAGVIDARQFTHARPEAIELVRAGENPIFSPGDMIWRECFVVTEGDKSDQLRIRDEILTMPDYFSPYETVVEFVSVEELRVKHSTMLHDGLVIAKSDNGLMEFRVEWENNPKATARIMLSAARAIVKMKKAGFTGAFSPLSVAVADLLPTKAGILSFV